MILPLFEIIISTAVTAAVAAAASTLCGLAVTAAAGSLHGQALASAVAASTLRGLALAVTAAAGTLHGRALAAAVAAAAAAGPMDAFADVGASHSLPAILCDSFGGPTVRLMLLKNDAALLLTEAPAATLSTDVLTEKSVRLATVAIPCKLSVFVLACSAT